MARDAQDPSLASGRIGIVIATRDRRDRLLDAVARMRALPERPPVVVADNGSTDGTVAALAARYGDTRGGGDDDGGVEVIALGANHGAAARTVAAARLRTPFVALSDDDS